MRILALETEVAGVGAEAFTEELLRDEAARAWELQQEGVIRELYFRRDRDLAVLVLECESPGAARRYLATLPLVRRELIAFDIIPLSPYPGFARLFADARLRGYDGA
jgi:muconolactone delta-isomerase